jgi:hypothetical protein
VSSDPRSPAERLVTRDIADQVGEKISERRLQSERTLENYLRAGVRPRWMERLMEIESATKRHRRELAEAHAELREVCGADAARFTRRWRQTAAAWDFSELNELIATHNTWYPIERDLPQDPRTGDYIPVMGRPHTRRELDAAWILEQFPA